MKRLLVGVIASLMAVGMFAQVGVVNTIAADTLIGSETLYFYTGELPYQWNIATIQVVTAKVGGTPDGILTLEGSVDGTSYVPLKDVSGLVSGFPDDSLDIPDAGVAVQTWVVERANFKKFRVKSVGTSGDSTLLSPVYSYK